MKSFNDLKHAVCIFTSRELDKKRTISCATQASAGCIGAHCQLKVSAKPLIFLLRHTTVNKYDCTKKQFYFLINHRRRVVCIPKYFEARIDVNG